MDANVWAAILVPAALAVVGVGAKLIWDEVQLGRKRQHRLMTMVTIIGMDVDFIAAQLGIKLPRRERTEGNDS